MRVSSIVTDAPITAAHASARVNKPSGPSVPAPTGSMLARSRMSRRSQATCAQLGLVGDRHEGYAVLPGCRCHRRVREEGLPHHDRGDPTLGGQGEQRHRVGSRGDAHPEAEVARHTDQAGRRLGQRDVVDEDLMRGAPGATGAWLARARDDRCLHEGRQTRPQPGDEAGEGERAVSGRHTANCVR